MSDIIQSLADAVPAHLRERVEQELLLGWRMNEVKAKSVAKQSAIFHNSNAAKSVDGIGEKIASIPLDAFHYWSHRLGKECWSDDQFVNDFIRDNPEVAVRNRVKRTTVQGAIFTGDGYLIK